MGLNPVFFRKLFPTSVDTEYMKPRPCPVAVAAKQRSAVSTDSHFIFMSIAVLVVIMITGSSRYQKQALFLSVPRLIYSVFNCSPYVENYGGRVASVIAFGGKYRLRFRAACLTGRVPYIGRPSCGAAVYGVCQLNRMPMPAYMV